MKGLNVIHIAAQGDQPVALVVFFYQDILD